MYSLGFLVFLVSRLLNLEAREGKAAVVKDPVFVVLNAAVNTENGKADEASDVDGVATQQMD